MTGDRKSVRIMDASELYRASLRPLGDGYEKNQTIMQLNMQAYEGTICSCMFMSIV